MLLLLISSGHNTVLRDGMRAIEHGCHFLWPLDFSITYSAQGAAFSEKNSLVSKLCTRPEDFPGGSDGKASVYNAGRPGFNPWVGKLPWRRKWHPTAVLLPGKSHGWRSLVGYSPWGLKELDTTERLHFTSLKSYLRTRERETEWCEVPAAGPTIDIPVSLMFQQSIGWLLTLNPLLFFCLLCWQQLLFTVALINEGAV